MTTETEYTVAVLPAGPEDPRPAETLAAGSRDDCLERYQALREDGDPAYEGRALAVLDPDGRPVYAA